MNGAQWLVHTLQNQHVNTVFGYPGGAIMPVYDALYDGGVRHVLCRHEQGAAMAAIGYARASGKTGVCIATSGPGATNLITGLADALLDSVPVVAITGQVGSGLIGTDAFQEVDVLGLSLACTKHSYLVQSAAELPQVLYEAFQLASRGRPGPVLVDIPKDIQQADYPFVPYADTQEKVTILHKPLCVEFVTNNALLEQGRHMIAEANKPVLYAGGGVAMAKAVAALREFLAITAMPVVTTLKALGAVSEEYAGYLGMPGMHGMPAANHAIQQCDLLIAAGARFDDRVTGRLDSFAPHAKVIHLDIDPAEFNKLRRADLSLCGDLTQLLAQLQQPLHITHWQQTVSELKNQYRWRYDNHYQAGAQQKSSAEKQSPGKQHSRHKQQKHYHASPLHNHYHNNIYAPRLLKQLSDHKPANCVITTDVGQHQMWTAQHMTFSQPENFITSSGLGTMGFGLPAAIGAQLARPDCTVLCVSGDGSFMMNVQELATIKRLSLPLKIVLLDNQRLGMVRQWQQLFFDHRYSETHLDDNPDFVALAQVFAIDGQCIEREEQVSAALNTLLNHQGAYLLHVKIHALDNVWPLVPPGASNSQMLEQLS